MKPSLQKACEHASEKSTRFPEVETSQSHGVNFRPKVIVSGNRERHMMPNRYWQGLQGVGWRIAAWFGKPNVIDGTAP
jgi:hypothetical protein